MKKQHGNKCDSDSSRILNNDINPFINVLVNRQELVENEKK
ncbi:MAG: hypothetical protein ABI772_14465 [Bacteroidota bacterium]